MNSKLHSFLYFFILVLVIFFLDVGSKLFVMNEMSLYESIPLIPYFSLTYVHNVGAAFSLLSGQRWFLAFVAALISIIILVMIYLDKNKRGEKIALSLILGGALGNLFDRIYHGYVIDFFDFYIGDWHYPIFNIADCAICIGFILFFIMQFMHKKTNKQTKD